LINPPTIKQVVELIQETAFRLDKKLGSPEEGLHDDPPLEVDSSTAVVVPVVELKLSPVAKQRVELAQPMPLRELAHPSEIDSSDQLAPALVVPAMKPEGDCESGLS
jgi:hypothetical protein